MFKFFRHIRQQLIIKNTMATYLKYAIGEIVLVVIGILIALQINNWNEQRKANQNESDLYSRILVDMKIDENRIDEHISYYKKDISFLNTVFEETKGRANDYPIEDFSSMRAARIFNLIIRANYSKVTSEIKHRQVLDSIDNYLRLEQHVHDAFQMIYDFKEEQLKPYLARHGINDTEQLFNNRELGYYQLRETPIFSYSKLKQEYGSEELDQLLFDLGIRASWAKTALEDLLISNLNLQVLLDQAK